VCKNEMGDCVEYPCLSGEYLKNDECLDCGEMCKECAGSPDNCIECIDNAVRD